MVASSMLIVSILGFSVASASASPRKTTPSIQLPDNVLHSWGPYTPVFPLGTYKTPKGCSITQVNILQRHGARFPTAKAGARISTSVSKLQNHEIHDPRFKFLRDYKFDLGSDDLIPFGASQSFDSGQEVFERYSHLVSKRDVPFVRASSSSRVVFSATNWTAGFVKANHGISVPAAPPVLNEAANDTLDDSMCPDAGDSDEQTTAWQNAFSPAVIRRLITAVPGANLTNDDIPNLISLCAFDTLAKERVSPWCSVFDASDFASFEYYNDLDKYYGTGYGQLLGPVQGVGYINELIARLTGKPVSDATQTNRTLDSSPETFPLNRKLYVDFSHDNQMIAIFAAMGLFKPSIALNPTHPDPSRKWLASHLVPFASQFVIEKLACGEQEGVRMLLNDAIVPLDICGAGKDGICVLSKFVESQSYARNNGEGDFEKCFV